MPVIEVDGLTKRYDDKTVVDDVSFSVEEGEIFAILGPNGAGGDDERNLGSRWLGVEIAMTPDIDLVQIRRWVDARNVNLPERARDLIRYERLIP